MASPLEQWSLDDLLDRYDELDLSAGDDQDADDARAAEVDRIAAELLRREPEDRGLWYDRGLLAKWRRDWPAAREFNARALELTPEDERTERPSAWNLAVAATALRDWGTARRAWAAYGLPVDPEGDEPIDGDFGPAVVRLNPPVRYIGQRDLEIDGRAGDSEVVWGRRLDPARIRITSVPLPESGHRYGDVVLHDGAPEGTRVVDGDEYPVFEEIELWERSSTPTLSVQVKGSDEDVTELRHALDLAGLPHEDWTTEVGTVCRACSDGVLDTHDHRPDVPTDGGRRLGIAGDGDEALRVVLAWLDRAPGRESEDVVLLLE
ncbi:hypothetical protein [Blastococcus haudaquaticus]|uniref:Tetratricopeptide repeat protein n=1 Tax=Blastococcus haudaquaticus TaxID=1938745 RepID=A0A286H5S8_9ACTN|nr:hypothetical protein [Blastococcus haudaquaticus]SOE03052.1 hypothetical protein SAMN06272739_3975 [Blastococcus haudaquaticus]